MPLKQRPLSPHIQIYDLFKITSLTSILHRLTGIALVGVSFIVVIWLLSIAYGPQSYATFNHTAQSWYGQLVLFGSTWAFWYQFINGIRHLVWDAGKGFDISLARKTGVLVLLSSIVVTVATWFYIMSF